MLRVEAVERLDDPRGALLKVLPGPVPGEVYAVTSGPGGSRGHHLHRRCGEWFVALAGRCVLGAVAPDGTVRHVPLDGVRVWVPPGWAHALFNVGGGEMLVLALADQPYDPDDVGPATVPSP